MKSKRLPQFIAAKTALRYTMVMRFKKVVLGFLLGLLWGLLLDVLLVKATSLRLPLFGYGVSMLLGSLVAGRWLPVFPARSLRGLLLGLMIAISGLSVHLWNRQPAWSSHDAFRHCGRITGMSLWETPFPIHPSCSQLLMCINEYPYSRDEYRAVLHLSMTEGCPAP